jgi:DhnA family fructose-bisphosphate aldolase class Ia
MNWGLRNRLDRVLPGLPKGTGSVMFAIDHGYFMDPISGLEGPRKTIVLFITACRQFIFNTIGKFYNSNKVIKA